MSSTDLLVTVITGLLTIFSPLAIAVAKKESWSQLVKVGVPILATLLIAGVYVWLKGLSHLVTVEDWLQAALAVFGLQQLAYTTFLHWMATILEQVGQQIRQQNVPSVVVPDPSPLPESVPAAAVATAARVAALVPVDAVDPSVPDPTAKHLA